MTKKGKVDNDKGACGRPAPAPLPDMVKCELCWQQVSVDVNHKFRPALHTCVPVEHPVLKFAKVRANEDFNMPHRAHDTDTGIDLFASRTVTVEPGMWVNVPTNVACQLPVGYWAMIVGRSSTFYQKKLIVQPGIIDNGWRGELFSAVYNPTDAPVVVRKNERVTQLITLNLTLPRMIKVALAEIETGDRGGVDDAKGFGSSGS